MAFVFHVYSGQVVLLHTTEPGKKIRPEVTVAWEDCLARRAGLCLTDALGGSSSEVSVTTSGTKIRNDTFRLGRQIVALSHDRISVDGFVLVTPSRSGSVTGSTPEAGSFPAVPV